MKSSITLSRLIDIKAALQKALDIIPYEDPNWRSICQAHAYVQVYLMPYGTVEVEIKPDANEPEATYAEN